MAISFTAISTSWRCMGLMDSTITPRSSSPGSSPGQGQWVVFLGKTLNSHSASFHPPRCINGYQQLNVEG